MNFLDYFFSTEKEILEDFSEPEDEVKYIIDVFLTDENTEVLIKDSEILEDFSEPEDKLGDCARTVRIIDDKFIDPRTGKEIKLQLNRSKGEEI